VEDAEMTQPAADPLWLSAMIGRVAAIIGAAAVLYATADSTWSTMHTLLADGLTPNEATDAVAQFGLVVNATNALLIAVGASVAAVTSTVSKVREYLRQKG